MILFLFSKYMTHTPGPWTYSKQERSFEEDHNGTYKRFLIRDEASGFNFAALLDNHLGTEANARLIAAAPELLNAAWLALEQLDLYVEFFDGGNDPKVVEAIEALEEATSMATGQSETRNTEKS
jgi:hypothetical protein